MPRVASAQATPSSSAAERASAKQALDRLVQAARSIEQLVAREPERRPPPAAKK